MRLKQHINESSLSRLWSHMQKHDSGTITAWRDAKDCNTGDSYTKGEKKARNKVLLASLLRQGYSVTKVKGTYIENYDSDIAKEVGEDVFLVVDINDKGNLKKSLTKLGEDYDQDSILYIPKGGKEGFLIGTSKCEKSYPGYHITKRLGNPIFGKSGEVMTKVNGRPFILKEDIEIMEKPGSGMGYWAMITIGDKGWHDYYDNNKEILEMDTVDA